MNKDENVIIKFIEENILSRFRCPRRIVTDNAEAFNSHKMLHFCQDYGIDLIHSTTYYPQGNGLVDSFNKNIVRIIKMMLEQNKKEWDSHLKHALWAYIIITNRSIQTFQFHLIYGTDVIFPIHLGVSVMKLLQQEDGEETPMQKRMNQLIEVHQLRDQVSTQNQEYHNKMKATFDRNAKAIDLQVGDLVLKWDVSRQKKGKHGKFNNLWVGPFQVITVIENNTYQVATPGGEEIGILVNGRFLKIFLQYRQL